MLNRASMGEAMITDEDGDQITIRMVMADRINDYTMAIKRAWAWYCRGGAKEDPRILRHEELDWWESKALLYYGLQKMTWVGVGGIMAKIPKRTEGERVRWKQITIKPEQMPMVICAQCDNPGGLTPTNSPTP